MLYPGYGFVYLSFSKNIFAFTSEIDFVIKLKVCRKPKNVLNTVSHLYLVYTPTCSH